MGFWACKQSWGFLLGYRSNYGNQEEIESQLCNVGRKHFLRVCALAKIFMELIL